MVAELSRDYFEQYTVTAAPWHYDVYIFTNLKSVYSEILIFTVSNSERWRFNKENNSIIFRGAAKSHIVKFNMGWGSIVYNLNDTAGPTELLKMGSVCGRNG